MNFRRAEKADLERLVEIYNQAVPSHIVTDDDDPISVDSRREWMNDFDDTHPCWVVEENGQIIGWCGLEYFYPHPAFDHSAEISIYIDNKHQNQGVGSALLDYVNVNITKNLPIKTVISYIYERNVPSQRLFQRSGYDKIGELPQISMIAGELRTIYVYCRHFNLH